MANEEIRHPGSDPTRFRRVAVAHDRPHARGCRRRRLLALASIYDGARRTDAAKSGGMTL